MPRQSDEPGDQYPDAHRYRAAMDRYPRCPCGQQLWAPESTARGYCEHCRLHHPPCHQVAGTGPDSTELIRVPAPYLQGIPPERHTSEMSKYRYAYQTPDGRWRIERDYGSCRGGWRIDNATTAGTFHPVTTTPTLAAAKVAISEWVL